MLTLKPLTLREANAFVSDMHRHHSAVIGCRFCIGVQNDRLVGVCIVGRPVARNLDDGFTAEITRLCTDGTKNACSILYGASWRACKAIGYKRLVTYTLPQEGGNSLLASGALFMGEAGGGSWNSSKRPRKDKAPTCKKHRWEWKCGDYEETIVSLTK